MNPREQEIHNALASLPANIQRAVDEFDWARELLSLAREYGLQIDDVHALREETLLVVVGLESARAYKSNIERRLNISHDLAERLVFEANHRIFEQLQKMAFGEENLLMKKDDHQNLSHHLKDEGIHLLEENEEEHTEVEIPENPFKREEPVYEEQHSSFEAPSQPASYQEEISEDDLRGIRGHRINVDVLRTRSQQNPDTTLTQEESPEEVLGIHDEKAEQALDRALYASSMVSKGDMMNTKASTNDVQKYITSISDGIKKN